ncbi:STAS domain-containing protein [Streptomyces sp. NPDC057302]|uniref:STAS domain-containing protein n=1 Tax=Streptomyces sp. NPDC057302 TaxID=3346094 RepID=UPI00363178D5
MEQDAGERLAVRHMPVGRSATLISLSGELDRDMAPVLREAVVQVALRPGDRRRLLLDLSAVTYCGDAGLFTLLGVCHALDAVGIRAGIVAAGPVTRRAINRAGLLDRLMST